MSRPGERMISATREAYEIARGERALESPEITGNMWVAGKHEFEKWANRFHHAKTLDDMIVASDCAPAEIWKAMERARIASCLAGPDSTSQDYVKQRVVRAALAFTSCMAEFEDEPGTCGEHLDALHTVCDALRSTGATDVRMDK